MIKEEEEQTYEDYQKINEMINVKKEDHTDHKTRRRHLKKKKRAELDSIAEEENEDFQDKEVDHEDDNYEEDISVDSEEDSESVEEEISLKKKRKRSKPNKKKKRMNDLILREADEDDDEEEEDGDGEITNWERDKLMKEMMGPKLKPRTQNYLDQSEEELIKRYNNMEDMLEQENEEMGHSTFALHPSISDPKLWLVKCRPGKERESVESILHKYFHFNTQLTPDKIKILSACSFDALKGYIYIEAFKEANVREAIQGISFLRENSIKIVPITEMTQVFGFDKMQCVNLKPKDWVRIKTGIYENDIAQVIQVVDPISKIIVKMIPRVSDVNQKPTGKQGRSIRPAPKLFNPTHFDKVEQRSHPHVGSTIYWNKNTFKDGFLIKQVNIRSLITSGVIPTIEELKTFNMNMTGEENANTDLTNLVESIQMDSHKKFKNTKFSKGDKVKLIKGGLNGITGKLVSHNGEYVQLQVEVEGVDDLLEFPADYIVKDFLPGDMVRITSGVNLGRQGMLVSVDGETTVINSDDGEFKANIHDLATSTNDHSETLYSNPLYDHGDLVKINNTTNSVSYVLEVHKYTLKLLTTRGEVKSVSIRDVSKWNNPRPSGIDAKRNPITKNDTVKVIAGQYKSKKGVVKNIFKNNVFLFNHDFATTSGIFVEKSENVEIMGSELLVDDITRTGKVNFRKIPEEVKCLLGKPVKIIFGNWKGYFGVLKNVTDKCAYVELLSKNKTVTVELGYITSMDGDASRNMDFVSTPRSMIAPKTPSYYPQSQVGSKSPTWGSNVTPNYNNVMSPNPNSYMSPGNRYR